MNYEKLKTIAAEFKRIKVYSDADDFCEAMSNCVFEGWMDLYGPVFELENATGKERYTDAKGVEKQLKVNEWFAFWVDDEGTLYRLDPEFEEIRHLNDESEFTLFLQSLSE